MCEHDCLFIYIATVIHHEEEAKEQRKEEQLGAVSASRNARKL